MGEHIPRRNNHLIQIWLSKFLKLVFYGHQVLFEEIRKMAGTLSYFLSVLNLNISSLEQQADYIQTMINEKKALLIVAERYKTIFYKLHLDVINTVWQLNYVGHETFIQTHQSNLDNIQDRIRAAKASLQCRCFLLQAISFLHGIWETYQGIYTR